jgi:hypothetical protein
MMCPKERPLRLDDFPSDREPAQSRGLGGGPASRSLPVRAISARLRLASCFCPGVSRWHSPRPAVGPSSAGLSVTGATFATMRGAPGECRVDAAARLPLWSQFERRLTTAKTWSSRAATNGYGLCPKHWSKFTSHSMRLTVKKLGLKLGNVSLMVPIGVG